jgi:4-methylaminobutanoate oxidase (formaldehyde-forming)
LRLKDPLAPFVYHNEPIWSGDRIVGSVTSGAYGHRIGASLGMGYIEHPEGVDQAFLDAQSSKSKSPGNATPSKPASSPGTTPKACA